MMNSLPENVIKSKIERMEYLHILRVTRKNYRYVAYLLLDKNPCNRITLEVRM